MLRRSSVPNTSKNKAFTPYWALPGTVCATAAVPTLESAQITRVSAYPVFATETARRSGPPLCGMADAMSGPGTGTASPTKDGAGNLSDGLGIDPALLQNLARQLFDAFSDRARQYRDDRCEGPRILRRSSEAARRCAREIRQRNAWRPSSSLRPGGRTSPITISRRHWSACGSWKKTMWLSRIDLLRR